MSTETSTTKYDSPKPGVGTTAVSDNATALSMNNEQSYSDASIKQPNGATSTPNGGVYSIFNDYNVISLNDGNYPKTDEETKKKKSEYQALSALDLIGNPKGASIFLPRDFLLCQRYGLPVNRMITLRRFPMPCTDDIFTIASDRGESSTSPGAMEPDIGRMITYMDNETNKLSEMCKMGWHLNWKELTAATEDGSGGMSGDKSGVSGFMKSMAAYMDDGTISRNAAQGSNRLNMNPLQDQNKIYGPVDSVAKTTIRDIGLETDMSFTIVFDYELRSLNGLNQKQMFIDLLSNILAVTYNNGKFWGGARVWTGERPSSWMRKMAFMNPTDANDFMNKGRVAFKDALRPFSGGNGAKAAVETLKNIVMNGMNLALGKILDKVGRPSVLVMNSLLNNDNTGEWHLTIGNPLNPIMAVGNLLLKNTEIEFGDTLGYDDFPTTMKVTCTLEQGMPRDRAGIESIFNMGKGRTYWSPNTILKKQSSGSITTNMGTELDMSQVKSFGEFTDSDILRAADIQSDFLRTSSEETQVSLSVSTTESTYISSPSISSSESTTYTSTTTSTVSVDNDTTPNK